MPSEPITQRDIENCTKFATRNDRVVRIQSHGEAGASIGYPYLSTSGNFYNERGERWPCLNNTGSTDLIARIPKEKDSNSGQRMPVPKSPIKDMSPLDGFAVGLVFGFVLGMVALYAFLLHVDAIG